MKKNSLLIIFLTLTIPAISQDRIFNYTYQSSVLNPGQREIEVWNTLRSGREDFYRALDSRIEFEFGVAKNLQTAFYLNAKSVSMEQLQVNDAGVAETTIEKEMEWSFSNEWKYKFSDAVANTIGSALYAEVTVAPTEFELETKLILDKKIGKTMHALNIVAENEWETEVENEIESDGTVTQEVEQESEFKFEFDYGFSYAVNSHWNVGIEACNRNQIVDEKWAVSVLYAGPGFSYVKGPIWINFTVLPQISGLKTPDNSSSGLYLDGYEKLETRLLFSYAF